MNTFKQVLTFALLITSVITTPSGYAGVVAFEDIQILPEDYYSSHFGTVTSNGFDFYAKPYLGMDISDATCISNICSSNGTQWIGVTYFQGLGLTMTRTDGALFSLTNFEMAEAYSTQSVPTTLDIIGYYSDGLTVSESFAFDRVYDAGGAIEDFQFISLTGNWTNLQRVEYIPNIWFLWH